MKKSLPPLLTRLEKTSKEFWNISRETAEFLYAFTSSLSAQNVLEIGTSNGYSGIFLASACGKLYTIESHKERFALAMENFKKAGLSHKINQIKGHAPEILRILRTKFDLIFIDATKYEYASYLKAIWPKINKDGFLIADNAESHKESLEEFFKEVRVLKSIKIFHVPIGSGLLILQKLSHF